MTKGRTPPPAQIDHAALLRERLGITAYIADPRSSIAWQQLPDELRELYRAIGQAVMHAIVTKGQKRGQIGVASTYGASTQQPYVELSIDVSPSQLSPAKAREIALMLLEAADASESDALIATFRPRDARAGHDRVGAADRAVPRAARAGTRERGRHGMTGDTEAELARVRELK